MRLWSYFPDWCQNSLQSESFGKRILIVKKQMVFKFRVIWPSSKGPQAIETHCLGSGGFSLRNYWHQRNHQMRYAAVRDNPNKISLPPLNERLRIKSNRVSREGHPSRELINVSLKAKVLAVSGRQRVITLVEFVWHKYLIKDVQTSRNFIGRSVRVNSCLWICLLKWRACLLYLSVIWSNYLFYRAAT